MNDKTTKTLSERGDIIRIGLLPIYAKPLTLLQVQEIGELSEQMGEYEIDENQTLWDYAFRNNREAGLMAKAIVVSLFRRKLYRMIFGGYVKRHLDTATMMKCMNRIKSTFDFSFFFNATIFLRGMKMKKEKASETPHGDSWVES